MENPRDQKLKTRIEKGEKYRMYLRVLNLVIY